MTSETSKSRRIVAEDNFLGIMSALVLMEAPFCPATFEPPLHSTLYNPQNLLSGYSKKPIVFSTFPTKGAEKELAKSARSSSSSSRVSLIKKSSLSINSRIKVAPLFWLLFMMDL